jgi:plasmid stability protein
MDKTLRRDVTADRQHQPTGVLVRVATTGIYLVRGLPRDLQRAARVRAATEGTTLGWVLRQALHDYAAGTWTPQPEARPRASVRRANGLISTRG